jgi:signal transduction histidine kinase
MTKHPTSSPVRRARRILYAVVGATAVALGCAIIALPGNAAVLIPLGAVILAAELFCARHLLRRLEQEWRRRAEGQGPRMRTDLPVAIGMLVVLISFSGALLFSQIHLRRIESEAIDILEDSAPGIEHLSAVRSKLRQLGVYVNEYLAGVRSDKTATRQNVRATRHQLDVELAAYDALPTFPEENERLAEILAALALLDESTAKALDEADAGALRAARRTLHEGFHPRQELADDAVLRLKLFNINYARARAHTILQAKRTSSIIATAFGVLSALVAVVASVFVFRSLRRQARLMVTHRDLLAARATELDAFAGRVAHDLKDPLCAVGLRIQSAARRREVDGQLRDNLETVGGQIARIGHIIDALLEFARAGANPSLGARADLQVILDEVVTDFFPAAKALNAELRVDPFPPRQLACTPGALTSVLSNLLGNAVKYIVEGTELPHRISVRAYDLENAVRVEVQDNGPGLPVGCEERVFEPFHRLRESRQPGIGLGLATVKKIVEAYRGRVGVFSTPGRGSTFWFEIPIWGRNATPAQTRIQREHPLGPAV